MALYDAAGNRVDAVPDKVAKDFAGDGIIRPLVSCLRCHERNGGLAGLQPFHDDQSDLLRFATLTSFVPEVAQRIGELYDPDRLGKVMARAREDYTQAVGLATGGLSQQRPRTRWCRSPRSTPTNKSRCAGRKTNWARPRAV